MQRTARNGRNPAGALAVLGLLLAVAFLGHDVLMAAEGTVRPAHGYAADRDHREDVPHPSDCGTVRVAAQRPDDAPGADLTAIDGLRSAPCERAAVTAAAPRWSPPGRAPAALRAFLQVYRI